MTYIDNTGKNPKGEDIKIPISGNAATTTSPLGVSGEWSSGWLDTREYGGIQTIVESDVRGSYTISYSNDGGQTHSLAGTTILYFSDYGRRVGKFAAVAPWIKFDYKNNGDPQSLFYFKIDLLVETPEASSESLNAQGSDTRTALWTKSRIETKTSDDSNDYEPIYRTGNALNVHVMNEAQPLSSVSVSNFPEEQEVYGTVEIANPTADPETGLAKDATLKDGSTKVQVTNYPTNQTVTVSNPTSPTDISTLSTSANQTNGNQKTQVTNFPTNQVVTVSNPTANPETGLAKDTTLKDGTQKTQIINFPTSQTVNGTVTVSNPTTNPETGLAKDATLTNGSTKTQIVNGAGSAYGTVGSPLAVRLSDGQVFFDPRSIRPLTSSDVVTVANPQTSVSVSNIPANQNVTVTNFPTVQQVSGNISTTPLQGNAVFLNATLATTSTTSNQLIGSIYTVTSGKTFYLSNINLRVAPTPGLLAGLLGGLLNTITNLGTISVQTSPNGTTWTTVFNGVMTSNSTGLAQDYQVNYINTPIPSGTRIRIVTSPALVTGMTWQFNIAGIES